MSILSTPVSIGRVTLKNRMVMAPMQQYQGTSEAFATDYHLHHYSRRAQGGVGLVITESTAVSENGRLFMNDIGIFSDDHILPQKRIVDAVHDYNTPVFIQLCHGGRKSHPTSEGITIAPSALAYDDSYGVPKEMTADDIKQIIADFVSASKRSLISGFDGIELHVAHGYLLHQFLSPLSNQRTDDYGGSLENRARLSYEILQAIRKVVGHDVPIQIRVSASDYLDDGLHPDELGKFVKMLLPLGLDAVHVSSGGLLPVKPEEVCQGYQVPYAKIIKKYASIPVIAVGLIRTQDFAAEIIDEGNADCIAIGRPFLEDPNFVRQWV